MLPPPSGVFKRSDRPDCRHPDSGRPTRPQRSRLDRRRPLSRPSMIVSQSMLSDNALSPTRCRALSTKQTQGMARAASRGRAARGCIIRLPDLAACADVDPSPPNMSSWRWGRPRCWQRVSAMPARSHRRHTPGDQRLRHGTSFHVLPTSRAARLGRPRRRRFPAHLARRRTPEHWRPLGPAALALAEAEPGRALASRCRSSEPTL